MRSVFFRFGLLVAFFCLYAIAFAQDPKVEQKLDSIKKADQFSNWIYERINYVGEDPRHRLAYLIESKNKLWRTAKNEEEHHAYLNLLNTLAYYQLLNGNIIESIDNYEAAYSYYLKNKASNYEIIPYTLKPLSNNYTRIGDYERALYLQQIAINFLKAFHDSPENIALAYSNIAISYRSMGNIVEAQNSIYAGLKLVDQNSKATITLNNILADILLDQKEYLKALALIKVNINRQQKSTQEDLYWLIGSYTTAGKIYLSLNNTKEAGTYFNNALTTLDRYFKGSRLREKANLLILMGEVKIKNNQPELALQLFNSALFTLKITTNDHQIIAKNIYGDNNLVDAFNEMADAYLLLHQPEKALECIKFSLFAADQIRREFADNQTKERLQANLQGVVEKGIAINYQLYIEKKDQKLLNNILELAEQSKARTLLDQINRNQQLVSANSKDVLFLKKKALERAIIYNEKQVLETKGTNLDKIIAKLKFDLALINKQIKQKYSQFNFDTYNVKIDELLAALPKKSILEYFVGEKAIYVIKIVNNQINSVVKIANAATVKAEIQLYATDYFQHGPDAMLNNPKAFYQASYHIYQSILKGINLSKSESLVVIPDGVLGYISFDGLITQPNYRANISSWPFLIRSNTITYAFSLKTLTNKKTIVNKKGFTGLFITQQKENHQPLKAVADEANRIEKLINGKFLFNENVNAKSFNRAFEESKILHIGTHAYLSGKNQEPTLDFENEKIFLFELAAKKSAPSLVILSACRTADGLLSNGEGIISLSRGFNAVGTQATIAGLWNVNDVAAAVITSNFYQNLLQKRSNGAALHQAKLDWLNAPQTAEAFYLPYYWDSLIYMGVDQQIELQPAMNKNLLIGIGGILLLVTLLFLWKLKFNRKGR